MPSNNDGLVVASPLRHPVPQRRMPNALVRVFCAAIGSMSPFMVVAAPTTAKARTCLYRSPEAAFDHLRVLSSRGSIIRFASTTADCSTEAPDPISNEFHFVSAEAFLKAANADKRSGKISAESTDVSMARGLLRFLLRSHATDRFTRLQSETLLRNIDVGHYS